MSQINTLPPPPPPSSHARAHQLQEHYQQEQQYQSQNPIHFLTPSDVYAAYADTFDLSLLPDECDLPLSPACSAYSNSSQSQTLDYIPTTVYQHTTATTNNNNNNSTQIKIERDWSNLTEETTIKIEPTSMIDDQPQTQQQDEQNQHQKLERKRSDPISIPQRPTAHPQIYPSPQSSPEQTDCSFHARYGSNYSSLSSSRNSLYPPSPSSFSSASFLSPSAASPSYLSTRSPCSSSSYSSSSASSGYSSSRYSSSPYSSSPYASSNCSTSPFPATTTPCITANCSSVDISRVKQEFHTLPPSPPESSCEAPSPHCFADIKSEPLDADVETLIDINSLLSKSLENLHYSSGDSSAATETSTVCQQFESLEVKKEESTAVATAAVCNQDHQLLREYLEDTTFQRKHNLKPLALESLIGGLGVRGDIEPVISLALEHAKREAEATCAKLQILPDPKTWKTPQVHAWLRSTIEQFKLPQINDLETKFPENGTTLALLSEEEFTRRAPECGSTIHAQLEIWKLAYSNGFQEDNPATTLMAQQYQQQHQQSQQLNNGTDSNDIPGSLWHVTECGQKIEMDMDEGSDVEDDDALPPTSVLNVTVAAVSNASSDTATSAATATSITTAVVKPIGSTPARNGGSHIHLWQFLKELLAAPHINGTAIRWIDRCKGVFKIEDSVRVAKLWGRRKNRPAMNYDKLSRSIRQYYKKGIMKKTERSQRLVYQFCHPYNL